MIVEIPSPQHYGIVHKYKLTARQFTLYTTITQNQQQPLSSKVIHKLLISGVLTNQIKEL